MKTLAHEFLDVEEQEGFNVPDSARRTLDQFLRKTASVIPSSGSQDHIASAIDGVFDEFGFSYQHNGILSHALETKKMDCKGYSVLAYSAIENIWNSRIDSARAGLKMMIRMFPEKYAKFPVHLALEPNHLFLIIDDGVHMIDWQTTPKGGTIDFGRVNRYCLKKVPRDNAVFMAYLTCGHEKSKEQDHKAAFSLYKKAKNAFLLDGRAYTDIAYELLRVDGNNHPGRALREIRDGIKADPSYPELYIARAKIYKHNNRAEKALKDLTTAIHLFPRVGSYFTQRASVYEMIVKSDKALEDVDMALFLEPETAEHYIQRAQINGKLGRFGEAIADCTKYIKARPGTSLGYAVRGSLLRAVGRKEESRQDFEMAKKRDSPMDETQQIDILKLRAELGM